MTKLYSTHIKHITKQLIIASETLHKAGKLPEAVNMIRKTGDFFLPELKVKPRNKNFQKLKTEYEKTHSVITTSMINAMEKTRFKK